MSDFNTILVKLGERSYDIRIGAGLIAEAGRHIAPLLAGGGGRNEAVVITDETVAQLYLPGLESALEGAAIGHRAIILEPGEQTKDFSHLARLMDDLIAGGITRDSVLVALGGGVIGDIAGFAAAIALRGVDFVQVPTTLLAQVDSSVGGKTGINTTGGKNLVGAFYQPRLVLADVAALETLTDRELRAGYAEVLKYALIQDPEFFTWLEAHGPSVIAGDRGARIEAVDRSCRAKAQVVSADERERGERALLNLGHTFGHAMEAETDYSPDLLHGEAVAIGMVLAFELSARLGLCPEADVARLRAHYDAVGLPADPSNYGLAIDGLLDHMGRDKKVKGGRVTFILARGIGRAFIASDVDIAEVERLLQGSLSAPHANG